MVLINSPHIHCLHLSLCSTMAWRIIPRHKRNGIKLLYPEGDDLLHVDVCCKSLNSQVLLTGSKQMKIIVCEFGTVGRIVCNLPAIAQWPVSHKYAWQYRTQSFQSLWTLPEATEWLAICGRCRHEARCLFMAADTLISSATGEKPYCHGGTIA